MCFLRRQRGRRLADHSVDEVLHLLEAFSDRELPVFAALQSVAPSLAARSRVDKAAVWLWVWLETYCANLAAEVRPLSRLDPACVSTSQELRREWSPHTQIP